MVAAKAAELCGGPAAGNPGVCQRIGRGAGRWQLFRLGRAAAATLNRAVESSPLSQAGWPANPESLPLPAGGQGAAGARGAPQWFAEEVRPHEPALRGYLRNAFPSLEADEIMQESYLRLLRARAAGRIVSTKAYLFTIARNTARTLFRRRRLYAEFPVNELPDWRVLAPGPDAAEALVARERIELMSQAIAQLPDRCREVMRLAVVRGYSNAEIAVALGLSENTVRVHLARGIRKCAGYLRADGERP